MTTSSIEINPDVLLAKPVIRGARIPVELLLRKLSEGASEAELLDAYPRLTKADLKAPLAYAADTLAYETIILRPARRATMTLRFLPTGVAISLQPQIGLISRH